MTAIIALAAKNLRSFSSKVIDHSAVITHVNLQLFLLQNCHYTLPQLIYHAIILGFRHRIFTGENYAYQIISHVCPRCNNAHDFVIEIVKKAS